MSIDKPGRYTLMYSHLEQILELPDELMITDVSQWGYQADNRQLSIEIKRRDQPPPEEE